MPIISQFKQLGEGVQPSEYNALVDAVNTTYDQAQSLLSQFNNVQVLNNRFLAVAVPNSLNINIPGGLLRRQADGTVISTGNLTITAPANVANHWLTINPFGQAQITARRPRECYPVAQVTTSPTAISSLVDRRSLSFEISCVPVRKLIQVVKNSSQSITSGGTYQKVNNFRLESADGINDGNLLNLSSGEITITTGMEYYLFARAQITSPSNANLSSKLALFVGNTELRILEEKDFSGGSTRATLSGIYEGYLNPGDVVSVQVSVGAGSSLTIPNNNNTEIILKGYG